MSARHKLNSAYLTGSAIIAAILGAMAGSWLVFVVTFAMLAALDMHAGNIRR